MTEKICTNGHVYIKEVCDRCGGSSLVVPQEITIQEKIKNTKNVKTAILKTKKTSISKK